VPIDVEEETTRLYGLPLDEFVPERARVVKALRSEKRRAEASAVQELRKPTLSAWTVNQLARRRRKDVDLLLDAGHRVGETQRALLAGGERPAFETAEKRFRTVLRTLVDAAEAILADRASPATLERIAVTLRASALSDEARTELARGRLTTDVEPAGFGAFGVEPIPRRGERHQKPSATAERANAARMRARERAEAKLEAAKARARAAAEKTHEADATLRAATKALEGAKRDAERSRREHEAAVAAIRDAEAEAKSLRG
jgi:hypothetical protein